MKPQVERNMDIAAQTERVLQEMNQSLCYWQKLTIDLLSRRDTTLIVNYCQKVGFV